MRIENHDHESKEIRKQVGSGTVAAVLVLCVGFLAGGCASTASDAAPDHGTDGVVASERSDGKEARAGAAEPEDESAHEGERSDVAEDTEEFEWHVDEEGRRYRTRVLPKIEGAYMVLPDDRLVISYGLTFDIVEEREDSFVVKMYDVDPPTIGASKPRVSRQEIEEVVAAYETDLEEVDRLRFAPFGAGLPEGGQWRHGFELVDMNGDGEIDLVHGPARKGGGRPWIFLGDGEGNWQPWSEARFPADADLDYGDVAVADFNRDGHPDIAFGVHQKGVKVMIGDGEGGFRAWSDGIGYRGSGGDTGEIPFASRAIEAVDWNADGLPDLLAVSEGPQMQVRQGRDPSEPEFERGPPGAVVFLNRGDGSWTRLHGDRGEATVFGDDVALADIDGDGATDFVTASAVSGAKEILNLATTEGSWRTVAIDAVPSGAIKAVEATDLDGDGRPEVAVGYVAKEKGLRITGVDVYDRQDDGGWARRRLGTSEEGGGVWALASGDLDGDGRLDLVALTGYGERWVFLGTDDGSFVRERSPELAAAQEFGCRGYEAHLLDVDDDGRDELFLAFAGESGSEALIPGAPRRCPSGGSLEAWDPEPRE